MTLDNKFIIAGAVTPAVIGFCNATGTLPPYTAGAVALPVIGGAAHDGLYEMRRSAKEPIDARIVEVGHSTAVAAALSTFICGASYGIGYGAGYLVRRFS